MTLIKSGMIVLLLAMLSFMTLATSIGSARISGVDLDIVNIKFKQNSGINQTVNFAILVKNKGTEATQSVGLGIDFGNGVGGGFGAPIVIEPGETRVFTFGTIYKESGKFDVRVTVNTPEDVNLNNNIKTTIVNIK